MSMQAGEIPQHELRLQLQALAESKLRLDPLDFIKLWRPEL